MIARSSSYAHANTKETPLLEPPQLPAGQITKNGHFGRFFHILTVFSVKWRAKQHADRFARRFYIDKGIFGSLSVIFFLPTPPSGEGEEQEQVAKTAGRSPRFYRTSNLRKRIFFWRRDQSKAYLSLTPKLLQHCASSSLKLGAAIARELFIFTLSKHLHLRESYRVHLRGSGV